MSNIPERLKSQPFKVFETKDISEPLLMLYIQLSVALRDNSDTLVLKKDGLVQVANGVDIKRFPMIYGNTSLYEIFKKNILLIFERDDLVKQYFKLEQSDQDNPTIHVIKTAVGPEGRAD